MAKLFKVNGDEEEVHPKAGGEFSLEEMQQYVGGLIQHIQYDGQVLIVNKEAREPGKFDLLFSGEKYFALGEQPGPARLPVNQKVTDLVGTQILMKSLGVDSLLGDILLCSRTEAGYDAAEEEEEEEEFDEAAWREGFNS